MDNPSVRSGFAGGLLLACALLGAEGPAAAASPPAFVTGSVKITHYDGTDDDLLTAGLGAAGLQGAAPPVTDASDPAQLRRLAIYGNYRALVDVTPGGGYGVLYGPGLGGGDGKIPGTEYLAFSGGATGDENVTLMVQIPDSFDPERPCIVTGPSSGSRGVYGAIGTSGEWGLEKGCAVAYTDKGTGIGAHNLDPDLVRLIDGVEVTAAAAGDDSNFTAPISDAERLAFIAANPHRFAFKHAHSEDNPEASWGLYVIQSVEFALWAINEQFASELDFDDVLVIGSSVSNGGGATLLGAEQAPAGMFDGIAVSEPNVNPTPGDGFFIKQGKSAPVFAHGRPLYDYTTLLNLYQGCANFGRTYDAAPLQGLLAAIQGLAANACQSLREAGLLNANNAAAQARQAQKAINDYGILEEQNVVQPAQWLFSVPQSISVTYANSYSRSSVLDGLCGYSFAATAAAPPFEPVALAAGASAVLFASANGIPPTGGVNLVNDRAVGGPARNDVSVSPVFNRLDQNVAGALCLRFLETGTGPAFVTADPVAAAARDRLQEGVQEILATADLHGIPTLIVHGRNDGVLPPNHTSRPYYWMVAEEKGQADAIRYYEVLNAQHLDTFNGFPDFAARFIPLHYYFIQALDLLYDHLTTGAPLPPSQLVHTTPRGTAADPIGLANVPPIASAPAKADLISTDPRSLRIPD
jgi:hydroxybutyrate-dimer hydrolase